MANQLDQTAEARTRVQDFVLFLGDCCSCNRWVCRTKARERWSQELHGSMFGMVYTSTSPPRRQPLTSKLAQLPTKGCEFVTPLSSVSIHWGGRSLRLWHVKRRVSSSAPKTAGIGRGRHEGQRLQASPCAKLLPRTHNGCSGSRNPSDPKESSFLGNRTQATEGGRLGEDARRPKDPKHPSLAVESRVPDPSHTSSWSGSHPPPQWESSTPAPQSHSLTRRWSRC